MHEYTSNYFFEIKLFSHNLNHRRDFKNDNADVYGSKFLEGIQILLYSSNLPLYKKLSNIISQLYFGSIICAVKNTTKTTSKTDFINIVFYFSFLYFN